MTDYPNGLLFAEDLQREIKDKFFYVDEDPIIGKRLFFENAGGAIRLKRAVEAFAEVEAIPDCPERVHNMALKLQDVQNKALEDIRLILNAGPDGAVITSLTASQAMFDMVRAVAENIPGSNMVTSVLEHPSAFDCMTHYAQETGCELRVAPSNPRTGGVDPEEILSRVDKDTKLLNVMYASNITGAIYDMRTVVAMAREIKPDLYIICDAVQHAPHGLIDLRETPVDGINFAPYKFFGCRGSGIAYVSERLANLPHHKLLAKPATTWELGSPAPSQFVVVTEIVNYVCWLGAHFTDKTDRRELFEVGMTHIKLQERALMYRMLEGAPDVPGLRHLPNVDVRFDNPNLVARDFILGMSFKNISCTQAVREYEKRNVIVYDRLIKSLYSKRMLESFGLQEVVRVSPLHCHDVRDIDEFLKITREISDL